MKLALIDLDGVLADDRHRVPFALQKNWPEYFNKDRIFSDPVWPEGRALVEEKMAEGYTIEYLTGRRSAVRDVTEAWLDSNGFPRARVNMREADWYRNGQLVPGAPTWPKFTLSEHKVAFMQRLVDLGPFEQVVLFDDDPEVVRSVKFQIGVDNAVLCTWSVKPEAMVTLATA